MQNWRNNRNFRKYKNADGSFTYVVTVDSQKLEVSKEIYEEYASSARKMEYVEQDLKRDRILRDAKGKAVMDENGLPIILPEREVSLDKLIEGGWDFPSSELSAEDIVVGQIQTEELYRCLDRLETDERQLIDALFFKGMTERDYAKKIGVVQKTVNNHKYRVLKKLENLIEKK